VEVALSALNLAVLAFAFAVVAASASVAAAGENSLEVVAALEVARDSRVGQAEGLAALEEDSPVEGALLDPYPVEDAHWAAVGVEVGLVAEVAAGVEDVDPHCLEMVQGTQDHCREGKPGYVAEGEAPRRPRKVGFSLQL